MPYRVNPNGTIEADTPEEAVELAALLARKKHGKRPNAANGSEPAEGKKSGGRRRGTAKTRHKAKQRQPRHGVKLGQVYEMKNWGGRSGGRVIQVEKILLDGVVPKILKDGKGIKRKSSAKKIGFKHLKLRYRLIKDV
jgi:hypothetical protein